MASLTKKLLLKVPVVQSPMAGISTVKMAAIVTNNGGLGSIPFGGVDVRQVPKIKSQVEEFHRLTGNYKVNLNFFCHEIVPESTSLQRSNWAKLYDNYKYEASSIKFDNANISFKELENNDTLLQEFVQYIQEIKPAVISFHFGLPKASTISALRKAGSLVFTSVTSVAEAKSAFEVGFDGIICQGYEAGGHRGNFLTDESNDSKLTTRQLFEQIQEAKFDSSKYVIPAGGIMDSDTIKQYLSLGASLVQMGTIFLFSEESSSHPYLKTIPKLTETVATAIISGKLARCINTPFIQEITDKYHTLQFDLNSLPPYGSCYGAYKGFKLIMSAEFGFYLAGSNWKYADNRNTAEILQQLQKELQKEID